MGGWRELLWQTCWTVSLLKTIVANTECLVEAYPPRMLLETVDCRLIALIARTREYRLLRQLSGSIQIPIVPIPVESCIVLQLEVLDELSVSARISLWIITQARTVCNRHS